MTDKMIGRQFMISGMVIEVVSGDDEKWETRNLTTNETAFFKKSVLEKAIKLGQAEEVSILNDAR